MPELSPYQQLMQFISGKWIAKSIGVVADFAIADHLGDETLSATDLAQRAEVNADAIARVLRALSAIGVFTDHGDGRFSNNDVSRVLHTDSPGSLRQIARMMSMDTSWSAWGAFGQSVKTGAPCSEHVYGKQIWELWSEAEYAADGALFNDAMTDLSRATAPALANAMNVDDAKLIVDVGGGHGYLLEAILELNQNAEGIVYDLDQVVCGAVQHPRLRAEGGNFFESVPAGADVYCLKHILHDWDDERCVQILRHIRAAADAPRVVVCEHLIDDSPASTPAKLLDLEMLAMTGHGRERSIEEFKALFNASDFALGQVCPTETGLAVIEAMPV